MVSARVGKRVKERRGGERAARRRNSSQLGSCAAGGSSRAGRCRGKGWHESHVATDIFWQCGLGPVCAPFENRWGTMGFSPFGRRRSAFLLLSARIFFASPFAEQRIIAYCQSAENAYSNCPLPLSSLSLSHTHSHTPPTPDLHRVLPPPPAPCPLLQISFAKTHTS